MPTPNSTVQGSPTWLELSLAAWRSRLDFSLYVGASLLCASVSSPSPVLFIKASLGRDPS